MSSDKLISYVLSSAVKASLSQQKNQPKKKAITKKNPTATIQQQNVAAPLQSEGWINVGTKRASKALAQSVAVEAETKVPSSKDKALTTNAFYVPKKLEKKLHQAPKFPPKKGPIEGGEQQLPCKMTKSQRRNQARSRKREKRRLMKEKAALLQQKHALLQAKESVLQQQIQDMAIDEKDEQSVTTAPSDPSSDTAPTTPSLLLALPYEVLTNGVLSFLRPEEMLKLGSTSKHAKTVCEEGFLWQSLFQKKFPASKLSPQSMKEWKRAYKLTLSKIVDRQRCFSTQKTFMEDVLGVGVNFTVNPKTKKVDYVELSQDLLSETAFVQNKVRQDVFGNSFKLFLPFYFSEEHFQRALPRIRKTILALGHDRRRGTFAQFHPHMILDVFPKIVTTFVVLLSDHGISACRKSYDGITRVHRLFLALAHQYPEIQQEAVRRLRLFVSDEKNRTKSACPNLGSVLPLLLIVDDKICGWPQVRLPYVQETFDRMVLWACKKYPQLERTHDSVTGQVEAEQLGDQRVDLFLKASMVNLRLMMFHVYFLRTLSCGTTQERANRYDRFFGQPEPKEMHHVAAAEGDDPMQVDTEDDDQMQVDTKPFATQKSPSDNSTISFGHFRDRINYIMSVQTWQKILPFLGLPCPPTKAEMAHRLRCHVSNSRRKKYHTSGMDFSRVQTGGTSMILSKGQEYSASSDLRHVVFRDTWGFDGSTKFLDATCLLCKGKRLLETIDYRNRFGANGAIRHSGDVMTNTSGSHTIHLDLDQLDQEVTSCVFVLSAWAGATLADIRSPAVSFDNAEAEQGKGQLCTYDLDSQDKISSLTSVIMCRLYRVSGGHSDGKWHVQAIGDAHEGDASNYAPIYKAVKKLL